MYSTVEFSGMAASFLHPPMRRSSRGFDCARRAAAFRDLEPPDVGKYDQLFLLASEAPPVVSDELDHPEALASSDDSDSSSDINSDRDSLLSESTGWCCSS